MVIQLVTDGKTKVKGRLFNMIDNEFVEEVSTTISCDDGEFNFKKMALKLVEKLLSKIIADGEVYYYITDDFEIKSAVYGEDPEFDNRISNEGLAFVTKKDAVDYLEKGKKILLKEILKHIHCDDDEEEE